MSNHRTLGFINELLKVAKTQDLGTLLGRKVVATKTTAKSGLAKAKRTSRRTKSK